MSPAFYGCLVPGAIAQFDPDALDEINLANAIALSLNTRPAPCLDANPSG